MTYSDDEDYEPSEEEDQASGGSESGGSGTRQGTSEGGDSGYETTLTDMEIEQLFDDQLQPEQLLQELKPSAESQLEPFEVFRARRREQVKQSMMKSNKGECLEEDVEKILRRRRRRYRRMKLMGKPVKKRGGLSEQASALLGRGMQFYVQGELVEARNVLLEVMRLAPNVDRTYHTLGMIYEALKQPRKALNFFMIAAHLNPRSSDMWKQLVELSLELGFKRQSIYCLRRLNRLNKQDTQGRWQRAHLHYELGELFMAIKSLEEIRAIAPHDPDVNKKLARWYFKDDKIHKAIEILEEYSTQYWDKMTESMINIYAELLIKDKQFKKGLQILQAAEKRFPEFAFDLTMKLGKCHVQLGNKEEGKQYLMQLQDQSVEQFDDLFWEAGQLLMKIQCFEEAAVLLNKLILDERYQQPEVWNRIGECYGVEDVRYLHLYEKLQQSISEDDPAYAEVVCNLCEALLFHDRTQEAQHFLSQIESSKYKVKKTTRRSKLNIQDPKLSQKSTYEFKVELKRANLCLQLGDKDQYLQIILPMVRSTVQTLYDRMISRHGQQNQNIEEQQDEMDVEQEQEIVPEQHIADNGLLKSNVYLRKKDITKNGSTSKTVIEKQNKEEGEQGEGDVGGLLIPRIFWDDEQMQVYTLVCELLFEQERWEDLNDVLSKGIYVMNLQNRWLQLGFRDNLKLMMIQMQFMHGSCKKAIESLKVICNRWWDSYQAWNNFCRLYCDLGHSKGWIRFIPALRDKFPDSIVITIMSGHTHSLARNHAFAIKEYCRALESVGEHDLILLCLSVAFCNFAMSRRVKDRHQAVLQALALFQKYYRKRHNKQEAAYNMGRAAHHLGLYDMAIRFYEEALSIKPDEKWGTTFKNFPNDPDINTDIRMDAAHNLIQIYKRSGNFALCRQIMRKYLVI